MVAPTQISKLQWWLIGLLTTALTVGGSAWLTSIRGEVIAIGAKHEVLQEQVTKTSTRLLVQEEALREIRIDVREIRRLMELVWYNTRKEGSIYELARRDSVPCDGLHNLSTRPEHDVEVPAPVGLCVRDQG